MEQHGQTQYNRKPGDQRRFRNACEAEPIGRGARLTGFLGQHRRRRQNGTEPQSGSTDAANDCPVLAAKETFHRALLARPSRVERTRLSQPYAHTPDK